jgi:hypothetical protein
MSAFEDEAYYDIEIGDVVAVTIGDPTINSGIEVHHVEHLWIAGCGIKDLSLLLIDPQVDADDVVLYRVAVSTDDAEVYDVLMDDHATDLYVPAHSVADALAVAMRWLGSVPLSERCYGVASPLRIRAGRVIGIRTPEETGSEWSTVSLEAAVQMPIRLAHNSDGYEALLTTVYAVIGGAQIPLYVPPSVGIKGVDVDALYDRIGERLRELTVPHRYVVTVVPIHRRPDLAEGLYPPLPLSDEAADWLYEAIDASIHAAGVEVSPGDRPDRGEGVS